MLLRTKLHGKVYEFPDIRLLMGKANEEKSGDTLAGVGAATAAERVRGKIGPGGSTSLGLARKSCRAV